MRSASVLLGFQGERWGSLLGVTRSRRRASLGLITTPSPGQCCPRASPPTPRKIPPLTSIDLHQAGGGNKGQEGHGSEGLHFGVCRGWMGDGRARDVGEDFTDGLCCCGGNVIITVLQMISDGVEGGMTLSHPSTSTMMQCLLHTLGWNTPPTRCVVAPISVLSRLGN